MKYSGNFILIKNNQILEYIYIQRVDRCILNVHTPSEIGVGIQGTSQSHKLCIIPQVHTK
jgi:hypothetical protein